jgi:hypothetical protein
MYKQQTGSLGRSITAYLKLLLVHRTRMEGMRESARVKPSDRFLIMMHDGQKLR